MDNVMLRDPPMARSPLLACFNLVPSLQGSPVPGACGTAPAYGNVTAGRGGGRLLQEPACSLLIHVALIVRGVPGAPFPPRACAGCTGHAVLAAA